MTATHAVVIALDAFKGSIGARDATQAFAAGWRDVRPDDLLILRPMADGGEGTAEAFAAAVSGARRMAVKVTGPDGTPHLASWVLLPAREDAPAGIGVVDIASTSGIEYLGDRRLPWDAHTLGFGQAVRAAVEHGVSRVVLGLGSSASTDGGTGLLTALGARFRDVAGHDVAPGARGLADITEVDLRALIPPPPGGVLVLTDVTNPLVGPRGAAAVFGPQKGVEATAIPLIDDALTGLAKLLGVDPSTPSSGAAGGAALGLLAWGGELVSGASAVSDLIGLPAAVAGARLVITGEGSYDGQSAAGKVPALVMEIAAQHGVDVAIVAGHIGDVDTRHLCHVESLVRLAGSKDAAMAQPERWLRLAGGHLARRRSVAGGSRSAAISGR